MSDSGVDTLPIRTARSATGHVLGPAHGPEHRAAPRDHRAAPGALVTGLSDQQLAERAHSQNPDQALACLSELLQRDPLTGTDVATELVLGHGSDRVRARAALVLGHSDRPISRCVLRRALDTQDPIVLRAVAHSLGRIGTPEDLGPLAAQQLGPTTPVGRDVLMARRLIGYRHGLTDVLVKDPGMTTRMAGRKERIDIGVRVRGTRHRIVEGATFEVPTLSFSTSSIQTFRCSRRRVGVAIDAGLPADLSTALSRPRLLGAILSERPDLDRFGLDAWLLSDDRLGTGGYRPWLWLVRPDGTVVNGGRGAVSNHELSFVINQSRAPHGRPMRIAGTLVGGKVSVSQAIVGDQAPGSPRSVQLARPTRLAG